MNFKKLSWFSSKVFLSLRNLFDMPDIFWDGLLPLSQILLGQPENEKMIISNNGDATLLAIKPIGYMVPFLDSAILDINEFDGEISPLAKGEFDENF